MKYLLCGLLAFAFSISAVAKDYRFINGNDSIYSELCIAAAMSDEALKAKAHLYHMNRDHLATVTCNKILLKAFAQNYRRSAIEEKAFVFTNANGSKETELCIAAAKSNSEFSKKKSEHFANERGIIKKISCNDMSVASFARKHGNAEFQI